MERSKNWHRGAEGPATSKPSRGQQEPGFRKRATKGVVHCHKKRRQMQGMRRGAQRRAAEALGWRVARADDIQVGGALHWERKWVTGEKLEVFDEELP